MIPHETIEVFSNLWFAANIITIIIISLTLYYGREVLISYNERLRFAFLIGAVLMTRAIITHPYQIYVDKWVVESSLPLHLCGISSIISFVLLFRFNQFLYEFLVLLGIPGAIQALLTPELTLGIDAFFLIEYFISHGGIILSGLYLTIVLNHRPRVGSWLKVAMYSQVLLVVIHIINLSLDSNYMYTRIKPIVDNPLILGEHPYYYIGFEFIGLLSIILFYYLFTRMNIKLSLKEVD